MGRQIIIGPLIQTDENGALVIHEHNVIIIENGKILQLTDVVILSEVQDFSNADEVRILDEGQFIIPGFIDCHTHAVQFPNLGVGYDKSLLNWLETYTFPLERKCIDLDFAAQIFEAVVKQTIRAGTTTACYFASLYTASSTILAHKASQFGQRAFIGKVNMNVQRKDGYYESTEESIKNTLHFIEEIGQIMDPRVRPIITPRFALSCDMKLMQRLAAIARDDDLHIQSHVSENQDEIEAVKTVYKEYSSYTAVYDDAGLLTDKTVLAHGVHLTDAELVILKERGTAIIHCPSSNTCLRSGLCDVQRLKMNNIKIGLGTDVSGGQSYSMLDAMRSALQVSYHLSMLKDDYTLLTYKDVFHMATLGGARALSIDDKVGNLMPGKEFDALIIDLDAQDSILHNLVDVQCTLEEKIQRFIYSGDDRNIVSVYINGKKVK